MFFKKETGVIGHLNASVDVYEHPTLGTKHYHINDQQSQELSFLVGFCTNPMDHKGTPHILEHTVLCGSKKYKM